MAEYLEREALLDNLNHFARGEYNALVNNLVCKQPAADVEPVVYGRWEKVRKSNGTWMCSACGVKVGAFLAGCSEYCYHCGAKMDGGVTHDA